MFHLFPVSSTCTYNPKLATVVQSLYVISPSRSVSRAGEQEGVYSTEPLPPPLMSSTTGTGEREGEGNVDGDGRLVPQLMVDKDGKIVVNENRHVCVRERRV